MKITLLQLLVIKQVLAYGNEVSGPTLRRRLLTNFNYKRTSASFYELMNRMEKEKLIESKEKIDPYDGYLLEKIYRVTDFGKEEFNNFIDTFSKHI